MSPTGGVALVRPVILSVVALDSEEPIEDLLFPDDGSTSEVSSDMAFSSNREQDGRCDRVPVLAPGSTVPGLSGHGPARQEGAQYATSEIREMRSVGNRRNTARRVIRNHSVAEETISASGVRSRARRINDQKREESAWN